MTKRRGRRQSTQKTLLAMLARRSRPRHPATRIAASSSCDVARTEGGDDAIVVMDENAFGVDARDAILLLTGEPGAGTSNSMMLGCRGLIITSVAASIVTAAELLEVRCSWVLSGGGTSSSVEGAPGITMKDDDCLTNPASPAGNSPAPLPLLPVLLLTFSQCSPRTIPLLPLMSAAIAAARTASSLDPMLCRIVSILAMSSTSLS